MEKTLEFMFLRKSDLELFGYNITKSEWDEIIVNLCSRRSASNFLPSPPTGMASQPGSLLNARRSECNATESPCAHEYSGRLRFIASWYAGGTTNV